MFDIFSDFFDSFNDFSDFGMFPKSYRPYTQDSGKKCPVCGHTFEDFARTGKFGCSECYNTFRPAVSQTLRRIHQNPVHQGKIPSRSAGKLKLERQYEDLKKQLAEAVKNEDYEQAARLHKQIKEMEGDLQ